MKCVVCKKKVSYATYVNYQDEGWDGQVESFINIKGMVCRPCVKGLEL